MFRGFFYRAQSNQLEELNEDSLFSCQLRSDGEICSPLGATSSFLWLDVSEPTPEEVELLARRFKLDPQILEDLSAPEGRPKLHDYDAYIYLIFHALALEISEDQRIELQTQEVDCLFGPDWILTLHQHPIQKFDDLIGRWKRRPDWMKNGPGHLLYELMDSILDAYFPLLEQVGERIDVLEDRLYGASANDTDSSPLSGEIFALKRALLQIRHIAGPTRDVVNILLRRDAEEGGHHFAAFQDLYDHAARVVENIDTYREILSGALDAYLATESNRMNAVMKRLTAYSIILLLPTLVAGIYGMNFDDLPKQHGFYGSLVFMGSIIVVLFIYFKRRGWT